MSASKPPLNPPFTKYDTLKKDNFPDLEKIINDCFAPISRAYSDFKVEEISLRAKDIDEGQALFTVTLKAKRTAWFPGTQRGM